MGVVAFVVVGPEGPVAHGARRQPRPEDFLDVLEGQKLGPALATLEMLFEGGVFAHRCGRSVLGVTEVEDGGGMVNGGLAGLGTNIRKLPCVVCEALKSYRL